MRITKQLFSIFLIASLIVGLWSGIAYCQANNSYIIDWSIFGQDAGQRSTTNHTVSYSIGQPAGGQISSNGHYTSVSGMTYMFQVQGASGTIPFPFPPNDQTYAVPEPSTLLLITIGLFGLLLLKRKKAKKMILFLLIAAVFVCSPNASAYVMEFIDSGLRMGGSAQSIGVELGDLDGDNDLDIFVVNVRGGSVLLYEPGILNDPTDDDYADSGQSFGSETSSNDVALGDLDGDGDLDAFIVNQGNPTASNTVWLNDGSGIFSDSGQTLGNADSFAIALADIDSDGDLDAFVGNDGPNTIWLNDGSGTLIDSGQRLMNDNSNGVELSDLDGDGDLDAFVVNNGSANRVWLNDGSGIFSDSGQALGSEYSVDVELGDLDGDGDPDAFVSNYFYRANTVWLNNGSGSFIKTSQDLGDGHSYGAALGDVDGDGDLDALVANSGEDVLWINDGTGMFQNFGHQLSNGNSMEVFLKDIDKDGDLDAFIVDFGADNTLWYNQGELILILKPNHSIDELDTLFTDMGVDYTELFDNTRGDLALKETLGITRSYLLTPTASTDLEALRSLLSGRDEVEDCIYNQYLYFDGVPNDEYYRHEHYSNKQWNLDKIGMTAYWTNSDLPSSADVALAIIDSGIDGMHPDLAENGQHILPGINYSRFNDIGDDANEEDLDITDENGHGTHVTGIAGALTNNGLGIAGIAGNTKILPLKVGKNFTTFAGVFKAIEYAVDSKRGVGEPANIPQYAAVAINASWSNSDLEFGATTEEAARHAAGLHRWVRYASLSNVPFVTSMGNKDDNEERYPAKFQETIAVGATDKSNRRWQNDIGGSNYCSSLDVWLDLVAPGGDILSTVIQETGELYSDYDWKDGTSMAAAHVTGALGLLLSQNPEYAAEELRSIVKETADNSVGEIFHLHDCSGYSCQYGAGLLNVDKALSTAETERHVRLNPGTYDFGKAPLGDSLKTIVSLENPCNKPLEIFGASIRQFQNGNDGVEILSHENTEFRILSSPSSREADSGQICEFDIEFSPTIPGLPGSEGKKWAELVIAASFFTCDAPPSSGPADLNIQLHGTTDIAFPLTVVANGEGYGEIREDGVDCGTECESSYIDGTIVLLTALPSEGSTFEGWSEVICDKSPECKVTMDRAKTISATFAPYIPPEYILNVNQSGEGTGTIQVNGSDCGASCTQTFVEGTEVVLTAEETDNSTFIRWSIPACGNEPKCRITLEADTTVTAAFAPYVPPEYTLDVSTSGEGTGTIQINGSDCGASCTRSFVEGTEIVLVTEETNQSTFTGWSLKACGSEQECRITLEADTTVTAAFAPYVPPEYRLDVSTTGDGTGTFQINGSDCGASCTQTFVEGAEVVLIVEETNQSTFTGWSVEACGNEPECRFTLNADITVTAEFAPYVPPEYRLDVSISGEGTGTIQVNGNDCGAACTRSFVEGTEIVLTATETNNSTFEGWSLEACGDEPECRITLDADAVVIAEFAPYVPPEYTLDVSISGEGTGTIQINGSDCGTACTRSFVEGAEIVLVAEETNQSTFTGWSIEACGSEPDCRITSEADTTVTAEFAPYVPPEYRLDVNTTGDGTGTIQINGSDCGASCTQTFVEGTEIVLVAEETNQSTFTGWSLEACGSEPECRITLEADTTVTAAFAPYVPSEYTLDVSTIGGGTGRIQVNGSDCGIACTQTFTEGTEIVLVAEETNQSTFIGWSLQACSNELECRITLEADTTVTAAFAPYVQPEYILNVGTSGEGTGTIQINGSDCGISCTQTFTEGTEIVLVAEETNQSTFTGWSIEVCGSEPDCRITLEADTTVTAEFAPYVPPEYRLDVSTAGDGTGTIQINGNDCGAACTRTFVEGTEIVLVAEETNQSTFTGWSLEACGSESECRITLDADTTVTAMLAPYVPPEYTLNVNKSGDGDGKIYIDDVLCELPWSRNVVEGASVTLKAVEIDTSVFEGWSGLECGSQRECSVVMDSAKTVTATFGIMNQNGGEDDDGGEGDDVIDSSVNIPEPGTLWLIGIGLFGLFAFGRKKFRRR